MSVEFPKPGEVFEDRYEIESIIGTGGFATVYRATQRGLGRTVALKVLHRGVLDSPDDDDPKARQKAESAAERFKREARVVSQLKDTNTVTIHDYGETESGLLYIVFEHIDGTDLRDLIATEGALPPRRVVGILRRVLSSLKEAHGKGVLHRDIKPSNVMLYDHMGTDEVRLLDFGIARVHGTTVDLQSGDLNLTRQGTFIGTPRYMAPEQLRREELTPASDIFSLGLVAYEMLVGERANPSETRAQTIRRQVSPEGFTLPPGLDVPLRLRECINRMLESDPDRRFADAQSVLDMLARWEEGAFVENNSAGLEATTHNGTDSRTGEETVLDRPAPTRTGRTRKNFEETLLTDGGKWWEFLDPETYDVKEDLPTATKSSSDKLDWSRVETRRSGPVGFAFFNHCSDCGQGVPPDFTFCVHCGGEPRSSDRPQTFSVVIADFDGNGYDSAVELMISAGSDLEAPEVGAILDDLPAVFNIHARRDQAAALVAKLAEVGVHARTFPIDDPSVPWIKESVESITRQPWKLGGTVVVLLATIAASIFGSLFFLPVGLLAVGAFVARELHWYRNRYHVDVRRLLELLTGFDAETAQIARETLRNLNDREVRKHVTVCLMEYYTLTQQIRSHDAVYGGVLENARFALEELMADVLTLAHRYGKLDAYIASHPPAQLEQRIEDLRLQQPKDRHTAEMVEKEIAMLYEQLEQVRKMAESRRSFRERLGTLARSMEQIRERIAAVRARSSAQAWAEIAVDDTLRELEQEFEVFSETFEVVQ